MTTYSFSIRPDARAAAALFSAVEWESARYPDALERAIAASEAVLTAWEDDRLVGMMTAVSDKGMNVFFPYLLLHPDVQGHGVGKQMVERMLGRYADTYRKILVCNADKAGFYEKCGLQCAADQRPMLRVDPLQGNTMPQ